MVLLRQLRLEPLDLPLELLRPLRVGRLQRAVDVLEELLLPVVEEARLDALLLAHLRDGDLVDEVTTQDRGLLGGRERPTGLAGHGLSGEKPPLLSRREGESGSGWVNTIPPSAGYVTSFDSLGIGGFAVTKDDWFVELEASGGATSFGLRSELFEVSGDWMGGSYTVVDGKKVSP